LWVKQGGIAAQQADAVASAIAADAGAEIQPTPFSPVLRGLLLTGSAPRFLLSEKGTSLVNRHPLWWPPSKIVGRYLTPFLAEHLGMATEVDEPPPNDGVAVEIALETRDRTSWSSI
jgi:sulfide:quinone oxidoreductase